MALDVFEKYQVENLIDHLKAVYPNDLDEGMIEQIKKSVVDSNVEASSLTREITILFKGDKNKLEGFLTKYHIRVKNLEQVTEKTEEEVKHALNMKDVTDFTRDGKTYIKITYGDGRVQIIENRNTKDTKQIFEDVQRLKSINNIDGSQNAEEAFKELLKDYIEVSLENITFTNQDKYDIETKARLQFVEMHFPNYQVLASPNENIFVVKANPGFTVEVVKRDGKYELKQLEEMGYGTSENSNNAEENVREEVPLFMEDKIEESNEVSGYSIEELEQITNGMTEEEIVDYLTIHGKNPQQIMMILLSLEELKDRKRQEQEIKLVEKPKQKVYKNDKMAAFVDSLMLAFLVGALSGSLLFIILRILLQTI